MKKSLLIFTLLTSFFAFSQSSKIKFGFQAGLNYSNYRGYTVPTAYSQFYNESPAFAYLGGINFEYQMKEKLSLKIELNYERKSQKAANNIYIRQNFDDPMQEYNFTSKRHYDYLIVPILLKYNFKNKDSFYVNGGPFIGFLLQSKFTNDLNVTGFGSSDVVTTKNNKKTPYLRGFYVKIGYFYSFSEVSSLKKLVRNLPKTPNTIDVTIKPLISLGVNISFKLSNCHNPPIASTDADANRPSPILLHLLGVGFQ
jgi:hypothetical protein